MNSGCPVLPVDVLPSTSPSDRFVCNKGKSPTANLLLISPGSPGTKERHIPGRLEQMAKHLTLAPNSHDFEGFREDGSLQRASLHRRTIWGTGRISKVHSLCRGKISSQWFGISYT